MSFGNKLQLKRGALLVASVAMVAASLMFASHIKAASTCTGPTFDAGTKTLSLVCTDSTDTHELSCSDATNPDTLSLTVNGLTETLTCPGLGVSLTANGTDAPTVNQNENVNLAWITTDNPTSCTASLDWSGAKAPAGGTESQNVGTSNKTYSINCDGVTDTVTVSVVVPSPANCSDGIQNQDETGIDTGGVCALPVVPSATISASNCSIPAGSSSCSTDVTWSSTNVTNPISVRDNGNEFSTNANQGFPLNRVLSYGTHGLTFNHNGGVQIATRDVLATCIVGSSWDGSMCVAAPVDPNLSITANPTRVQNGQSTTIDWTATNPYSMQCKISGPGLVERDFDLVSATAADHNLTTGPITAKSIYTLSCTAAGTTFTDTVTVETQGVIEEI